MPAELEPARRYTDREVRLILKSAVDLQQRHDHGDDPSRGMSLVELEQVAAEAGLDPALVRRAARELDTPGTPSETNAFLGSPTHLVLEQVVDTSILPGAFDQLLDVTRAVTHEVGEVSAVGRQFGWKGRLDGAKTDVSVSAGNQRTTVRVRVALDEAAVGHFMLKGMLGGFSGGLIATAVAMNAVGPVGLVAGALILGSGYLWARRGLQRDAARYGARARELIDALVARTHAVGGEDAPAESDRPASLPNVRSPAV